MLVSVALMPGQKRVEEPIIHVQVEHGLVEIMAQPGVRVHYTKDGTVPASKSSAELYLGPFALLPGRWQLSAIAKRAGHLDSEVARFPALFCARDEDGVTVFCKEDEEGPNGAPGDYPQLVAGRCRFPAGARLREVNDVFQEDTDNLTIVNVSQDTREKVGRVGLMAASEHKLCRQVASSEWYECSKRRVAAGSALAVGATKYYIAAVPCGFLGFAPRTRKQRMAGMAPSFGGVAMDSTRYFRHQPFVPHASTGYQGLHGTEADLVHYESLALTTSAGAFGSESLHQVCNMRNVPDGHLCQLRLCKHASRAVISETRHK